MPVRCIDCDTEGVTTTRPIAGGGPRTPLCATHVRARRHRLREARHERHVQVTYQLPPGMYARLLEVQNGVCYICGPTTGARGMRKRLTVDHDHRCCAGPVSCGRCVRGLVCARCNEILGYFRDDPACFARGLVYLADPPAPKVLVAL